MPRNNRLKKRGAIGLSILTALLLISCSSYVPNSQVVDKNELSTYNPKIFGNKTLKTYPKVKNEDEWIIQAILYEQSNDFKRSNSFYKKLYTATNKDEYLLKELKTALYSGVTSGNIEKLKLYTLTYPNNLVAKRLLLSSYLYEKEYEQAKQSSQKLLSKSTEPLDYELSANAYILTKDYASAVDLLTQAYEKNHSEKTILKISTILVNYMGKIDKAISFLENHQSTQGCSETVCLQLLDIYFQQQNAPKLLSLYKSLYEHTQKEIYAQKVIESYVYLKDYMGVVEFLKLHYKNDELLYSLYIDNKEYTKAVNLSQKLLLETKDPKWYAELAMSLYESSSDKNDKEMLANVVQNFEKAVSAGIKNTVYLNYYGYTLIDKDIDVSKGVEIIKKVLIEQPDNTYYLDSLAWGYLKLNHCEEALKTIKKVVDIEGLDEDEVRTHWNVINEKCK